MGLFHRAELKATREFQRIREIPRRTWSDEQMAQCAAHYTRLLKTPNGTMSLRPLQAVALHELAQCGGLFGPLRVGLGKTLFSLLAPRMLNSWRPVLLLPASLVEKTKRELRTLMVHWDIPRNIQIQSYEMLGRDSAAKFLERDAQPDFIIADEAHRLKNPKAGVTRRVKRYMEAFPQTRFAAISGTLLKDDIEDFAHLLTWCLKDLAPVPREQGEIQEWAECLGHKVNPLSRIEPGPLLDLARPEDHDPDPVVVARRAFRRRLRDTPGVVASGNEHVSCSLYVRAIRLSPNPVTEENFRILRSQWETPDGWMLTQAVDVWRHARELALGFHYVWDPRPPETWLEARRQWAKKVRTILSHSKTEDTEFQVAQACEYGWYDRTEYDHWRVTKPVFEVNSRPIWHDDTALTYCAKWANDPGIVWVDHAFFGRELARRTGMPYYGEQGVDDAGNPIESEKGDRAIIASGRANSTGRNLQMFSRNLITCPPTGAPEWEQRLGRTHRDGQTADTVEVDCLILCRENWEGFVRALEAARASEQLMGHPQKLLLADIDSMPAEHEIREWARTSWRWAKSSQKDDE